MISLSQTEENYLKAIYTIEYNKENPVSTNAISELLLTSPASVSDMLKKLSGKNLINYIKYRGVVLTPQGKLSAILLVRKHRLWEFFLVNKLGFHWDEVHEVAEQLEHIQSEKLIATLDTFLGYPKYDPHGDPIPDENGKFLDRVDFPLAKLELRRKAEIVGVSDHSSSFLKYLDSQKINIGSKIEIVQFFDYDKSRALQIDGNIKITISSMVAENLIVSPI